MSFWRTLLGLDAPAAASGAPARNQISGTHIEIRTPQELEEALRQGTLSSSGQAVNVESALRIAAVFACVRIISGAVGNMPTHIKRRIDERTRSNATDHSLWKVFHRRPNQWQKPAQFKRMMQAHVLLRGNAYAFISRGVGGRVLTLTPLNPDRMKVRQLKTMELEYLYTHKNGRKETFPQRDILHLAGLSLNGITGLSVISYAREAIGLSAAMENHGATVFRNGANVSGALKFPKGAEISAEQHERLKAEFEEFRAGGAREGRVILLEDGLEYQQMALTAEDAQWLEARKFARGDIAMFFGVPPHMIGDTDKQTSWGTGLENQSQAFVTYTLEDYLVMWEEALAADCLDETGDVDIYVRFQRNALVRGDLKARWDAYKSGLQWGVYSPNKVLEMEDENPRDGGDIYYPPPNMTARSSDGGSNEP